MKLNLPLYDTIDGQKQRIAKAKSRAIKLSVDMIKSIHDQIGRASCRERV